MRRVLAMVFLGGVCGALARVGLADAVAHDPGAWPWATFVANVAGAFALGALVAWRARTGARAGRLDALLGPGVCGALTTFSTLQLEVFDLIDAGDAGLALAYAAASVGAGLAAVGAAQRVIGG